MKFKRLITTLKPNPERRRIIIMGCVIVLITLIAYYPALNNGYIWDDDFYITNNKNLRSFDGLKKIWLDYKTSPQYYPLVFTSYWIEYRLWELEPFGYHLINILLHAFTSSILWIILRELEIPGAWLAAAIFAVHPVNVESVAWATERKNVLSGVFYCLALLAYLRFSNIKNIHSLPSSSWRGEGEGDGVKLSRVLLYLLALFSFIFALLSKTVTASLPAAIILLLLWKKGRLVLRDIILIFPFFFIGITMGLITAWIEKYKVGAKGEEWLFSLSERFIIAGRAFWFYFEKNLYPAQLTFNYPRWEIDAGDWTQFFFPLTALGLIIVIGALHKRIGKGPLVAVLFFTGTLTPVLGFLNVYPFRYSFVADHFQYLACIGIIVLFSALIQISCTRLFHSRAAFLEPGARYCYGRDVFINVVCFGIIISILGFLTYQQIPIYKNSETLWRDTIAKNRSSWMAYNNLGIILADRKKFDNAIELYQKAIHIKPDYFEAHNNMGLALSKQGQLDKAITHYNKALQTNPKSASVHNNLGIVLENRGRTGEAEWRYSEAIRLRPNYSEAHINLANFFTKHKKFDKALFHYFRALQITPDNANLHFNIGASFALQGKLSDAINHYYKALKLNPNDAEAHNNIGIALVKNGQPDKAIHHFTKALEIDPNYEDARSNLNLALQQKQE